MRLTWIPGAMAAAVLAGAPGVAAQSPEAAFSDRPVVFAGGDFLVARPTGEFADYIDTGFGLAAHAFLPLAGERFGLRFEGGFLNYGNETRRVCFSSTVGCRIQADLTTSNNIFFGGLGPELALATGRLRPWVAATAGFAYFSTQSNLRGLGDREDIATTENFGDGTLAWRGGGGLDVRVAAGRVPVWLSVGAQYHGNGRAEYLTEGDITDQPDGSITIHPNRSQTNFVTYQLGATVGIPRGLGSEDPGPFRRR